LFLFILISIREYQNIGKAGSKKVEDNGNIWKQKNCYHLSCTRLRILLNTICRKPGFNSLRTPLNHGAEQASNETLKQTQQRNWSNASQGRQTALKEHFAVLHYETASTTQQPWGNTGAQLRIARLQAPLRGKDKVIIHSPHRSISLNFSLETTLESECFEPLVNFLAFLFQKLWPENSKLIM